MRVLPTTKCLLIAVWMSMFLTTPGWAQAYPAEWDQMDLPQLTELARNLVWRTHQADLSAQALLAQYAAEKFSNAAKDGPVDIHPWLGLIGAIGHLMPDGAKGDMAKAVTAQIVPDSAAVAALDSQAFLDIRRAFKNLRCQDQLATVAETWLTASDKCQELDAWQLARLAGALPDGEKLSFRLKHRLADLMNEKYVMAQCPVQVRPHDWQRCAQCVRDVLRPSQRARWATAIRGMYLDTQPLSAISGDDFQQIARALGHLEDPYLPGTIMAWASANSSWKQWDVQALRLAISRNLPRNLPQVAEFRQVLVDHLLDHLGEYCATDSPMDLYAVGEMLDSLDQVGAGQEYPVYASAVVRLVTQERLAKTGQEPTYFERELALPLGAQQIAEIRNHLVDRSDQPDLTIANILTWAYLTRGGYTDWVTYLESTVEQSQGDIRSQWCLARAYCDAISEGGRIHMENSRTWLDAALSCAESSTMRLAVLKQIAQSYVTVSDFAAAHAILSSVAGQFSDAEAIAEIALLQQHLDRLREDSYISFAEEAAYTVNAVQNAYLREIHQRIQAAQAAGQSYEAARLAQLCESR